MKSSLIRIPALWSYALLLLLLLVAINLLSNRTFYLPLHTQLCLFSDEGFVLEHHRPSLDRWTLSIGPLDTTDSMVIDENFQPSTFNFCGLRYDNWHLSAPLRGYPAGTIAYWKVSIDRWLILTLLFLLLTLYITKSIRRVQQTPTSPTCLHCGYDLRATPTRCPECGK